MPSFEVDLAVLAAAAAALEQHATFHRAVADQVQSTAQVRPTVGDLSVTAPFQQAWYGWVQTRFEDLQAAAAIVDAGGAGLRATAEAYGLHDVAAAAGLGEIAAALGVQR